VLPAAGIYHITARGVARCAIFHDDFDRGAFVALLRAVVRELEWNCHAYCLMGNHYHLVVETNLGLLSTGQHRLNGVYARRFNLRHGRVGHLFQDRFHARVIEDDEHFGNACEYVWNNPVRSGMCIEPHEWPWSGRILRARVNRR
jgi:REP element-mobilizing transposase RayT